MQIPLPFLPMSLRHFALHLIIHFIIIILPHAMQQYKHKHL